MNNEAIIEISGDSSETNADNDRTVLSSVQADIADDTNSDCANGVCVLNWKPQHPNAA